jgi:Arc/MetJ-type ribon-helix-helix transcriptional regulator
MNISLSPELEKRIAQKVERGDVDSAEALVENALTFYFEYEAREIDQEESRETQTAIAEALEHGPRGEGYPAADVFSDLRAKYGISC